MRIRHLWILACCVLFAFGGCSSNSERPILFVSNMDYPESRLGILETNKALTSLPLTGKASEAECSSTCRDIALITEIPTDGSEISIVEQESAVTRTLTNTRGSALENLHWSFDDKLLAYFERTNSDPPGSGTVHVVNSTTGESIASFPDTLTFAWSPISNTIALYRQQAVIEIYDLNAKKATQINEPTVILPPFHSKFVWSADGLSLLVADNAHLKIIDPLSMNVRQVMLPIKTFNHYYTEALSASPVNKDLVLVTGKKQLRAGEQIEPILWLVNIVTGEMNELPVRKGMRNVSWSPKGDEIAFIALSDPEKSDAESIYAIDLTNKATRRILNKDLHIYSMSWW